MDEPATAQKALEKNNHTVDLLKKYRRKSPRHNTLEPFCRKLPTTVKLEVYRNTSVYRQRSSGQCQHLPSRVPSQESASRNILKLIVMIIRKIEDVDTQLDILQTRNTPTRGDGTVKTQVHRTITRHFLQAGRSRIVIKHALRARVLIPDSRLQQDAREIVAVRRADIKGAARHVGYWQPVITDAAGYVMGESRLLEIEVGKDVQIVNRVIFQCHIDPLIDGVTIRVPQIIAVGIVERNILVGIVQMVKTRQQEEIMQVSSIPEMNLYASIVIGAFFQAINRWGSLIQVPRRFKWVA